MDPTWNANPAAAMGAYQAARTAEEVKKQTEALQAELAALRTAQEEAEAREEARREQDLLARELEHRGMSPLQARDEAVKETRRREVVQALTSVLAKARSRRPIAPEAGAYQQFLKDASAEIEQSLARAPLSPIMTGVVAGLVASLVAAVALGIWASSVATTGAFPILAMLVALLVGAGVGAAAAAWMKARYPSYAQAQVDHESQRTRELAGVIGQSVYTQRVFKQRASGFVPYITKERDRLRAELDGLGPSPLDPHMADDAFEGLSALLAEVSATQAELTLAAAQDSAEHGDIETARTMAAELKKTGSPLAADLPDLKALKGPSVESAPAAPSSRSVMSWTAAAVGGLVLVAVIPLGGAGIGWASGNGTYRAAVAADEQAAAQQAAQEQALQDRMVACDLNVARTSTERAVLDAYTQCEDVDVRVQLARNPAISDAALFALAEDPSPLVRIEAIRTTRLPMPMIAALLNDADPEVRDKAGEQVTYSSVIAPQLQELIAQGPKAAALARVKNLDPAVVQRLLDSDDETVLKRVAQREDLSRDDFARLLKSKYESVAFFAGNNDAVPADLLLAYAKRKIAGPDMTVAQDAALNLAVTKTDFTSKENTQRRSLIDRYCARDDRPKSDNYSICY